MQNYLAALGWWNFAGSFFMLGFFDERFGKKVLNEWTMLFKQEFKLNYWSKFWLFWAIGLNIFFGLINICAARWDFKELSIFLTIADVVAYVLFVFLAIWGIKAKRTGSGIYSVFIIFGGWIAWGLY